MGGDPRCPATAGITTAIPDGSVCFSAALASEIVNILDATVCHREVQFCACEDNL